MALTILHKVPTVTRTASLSTLIATTSSARGTTTTALGATNPQKWYFADYQETNNKASLSTTTESSTEEPTPSSSRPFRICFLGTPEVAATTLQTLHTASLQPNANFEIAAVVTQPPKKRKKRSKTVTQSPVGQLALDLNLPLLTPIKANSKVFLNQLATDASIEREPSEEEENMGPNVGPIDLCITAAYGQYLPKRFLATPALGTVNIHPSLLPKWRGASPVQRSLQAGDNPIGVSVLYTVSAMDAGPIVAQTTYDVKTTETATTVLPTLFEIGTDLLLQQLPAIFSGAMTMETATPQNENDIVMAPLIDSTEGQLHFWKDTATQCHNKMRGFSDWPQTYFYLKVVDPEQPNDQEPTILKVKVTETRVVPPDELEEFPAPLTRDIVLGPNKKKDGLRVVCLDGSVLELRRVQPAGKAKPFGARDLQNGYPRQILQWIEQTDTTHVPAGTASKKKKSTTTTATTAS
eukprot:CAMPEP_0172448864 /NCGR_PEP_ID=MMETSP1065-20121228/7772_1 /TAXON_ID=265537 /ORGANISM="Amphiprora paludosa, Strain CCMP125" /LENGTH=465 /DNA_ID=CAMNT_0013200453 /DNA_START=154 /DNA_END=1551 /DNA_ORIENTATION=+